MNAALNEFIFRDPWWFLALFALPVLALMRGRMGPTASIKFSSAVLLGSAGRNVRSRAGGFLLFLRMLALVLLISALARPQYGQGYEEMERSGIDIALVVDVSETMEASDFKLNGRIATRLDAAKAVLDQFIRARTNDRICLIAFSGLPYMVSPPTLNHDWLLKNLDENVKLNRIREGGTAIGRAIGMGVNRLRDLKQSKSKIVILLTDGVNTHKDVPPKMAAEAAANYGIKIYTIGVGSDRVVPLYDRYPDGRIKRDFFGNYISRGNVDPVDVKGLKEIADITSAKFFRARGAEELSEVYDEIDKLETTMSKMRRYENYEEWYHWFALTGLLFLLIEVVLSNTRLRRLP